jgi:hypothetical protein
MSCHGFSVKAADHTIHQVPPESVAGAHDFALIPEQLECHSVPASLPGGWCGVAPEVRHPRLNALAVTKK